MDYPQQPYFIPEQQQGQQGEYLYPPIQSPINENTLVSQTNPKEILEELAHKLRCELEVTDHESSDKSAKKWYRPDEVRPLLNEKGVHSILVDAYGIVNQITILSNLNDEDVRVMVLEHAKALTLKLAQTWKEFDIDKSNLTTIVLITTSMIYASLKRGLNQGERTFLKTAVSSREQIMIRPKNMDSMGQVQEDKKFWQIWK